MKIAIVLLAIVGLVAASSISKNDVKVADKEFLAKQKFLFEIVYRVEDPLMFEEYIKLGKSFTFDKSHYSHFDKYMEKFYEAYKHDALLPKGEFFGALVNTHLKQAYGLFEFFYYAKNWEVFQSNVAWARMHCNEGMFVYALTLAVIHRDDFNGLILPSIYEIFPQYFFNSKFVYVYGSCEKFDYRCHGASTSCMRQRNTRISSTRISLPSIRTMTPLLLLLRTKDFKCQWYKMNGFGRTRMAKEPTLEQEESSWWNTGLYNVRQLLSRILLGTFVSRFGEIPDILLLSNTNRNTVTTLNWFPTMVLVTSYGARTTTKLKSYGKFDYYYKVMGHSSTFDEIIAKGFMSL
ncbi:Arylphorin subunit C223 [Lucilia cuprina]|nr:Arylphorin subunit C223 [Lucilia cuprina]